MRLETTRLKQKPTRTFHFDYPLDVSIGGTKIETEIERKETETKGRKESSDQTRKGIM